MNLKTYIKDPARRDALVAELGTSKEYLWQVAEQWRGRKASPDLAKRIDAITGGQVPRHELRPDIWDAPAVEAVAATQPTTPEARAA
jgi:DNA-binding transcriptional regulator YdaS (Cro superfamily)